MLHVWNIYQNLPEQNHPVFRFVGKYTIHGAHGIEQLMAVSQTNTMADLTFSHSCGILKSPWATPETWHG